MDSAPHHFNNEAFAEGRNLIIQGIAAIKANVRTDNLISARETLGRVCHTLQVGEREIQSGTMTSIIIATKLLKNMVSLIIIRNAFVYGCHMFL